MSNYVDNHSLAKDLPQYSEAIHEMKMNNNHFSRLLGEYEELDRKIVRVEQGINHSSGLELDTLKMKRVHLKDDLLRQLQNK